MPHLSHAVQKFLLPQLQALTRFLRTEITTVSRILKSGAFMPSERQLAANRLNAQKSTGPRTLEGKARASQNAFKTGVHAESQIIRGETAEAF